MHKKIVYYILTFYVVDIMDILLTIIYLALTFIVTLLCYKFFGKYGLIIWICVCIIMCNIQTVKIGEFLGLTLSLGNILYGAIFLSTDILNHKYGKHWAFHATKLSFIVMIAFCIFMYLFLFFTPSPIDTSQSALEIIFSYVPRITFASLVAYYIGQTCDIHIFQFLKKKFNKLWLSNTGSTAVGQTVDTILFVTIAFAGLIPGNEIIEIILTMIAVKLLIAVCDTPFMYIANSIKKVKEIE